MMNGITVSTMGKSFALLTIGVVVFSLKYKYIPIFYLVANVLQYNCLG
jgi:hypothetical protein